MKIIMIDQKHRLNKQPFEITVQDIALAILVFILINFLNK